MSCQPFYCILCLYCYMLQIYENINCAKKKGSSLDQEKYIMGDLSMSENYRANLGTSYINILVTEVMSKIITSNTRLSKTSVLIDHVICNTPVKVSQHGVLEIGFSDHQIIFCTRKLCKNKFVDHNAHTIRSLKHHTTDKYKSLLTST